MKEQRKKRRPRGGATDTPPETTAAAAGAEATTDPNARAAAHFVGMVTRQRLQPDAELVDGIDA